MNKYEFMFIKEEDTLKITSPTLSIVTLIRAFNLIEQQNDRVLQIKMKQDLFNKLKEKIKEDQFQSNTYQKLVDNMSLLGASIIIDDNIQDKVVLLIGEKKHKVKIFIEK